MIKLKRKRFFQKQGNRISVRNKTKLKLELKNWEEPYMWHASMISEYYKEGTSQYYYVVS